jgi:hypothetical protein
LPRPRDLATGLAGRSRNRISGLACLAPPPPALASPVQRLLAIMMKLFALPLFLVAAVGSRALAQPALEAAPTLPCNPCYLTPPQGVGGEAPVVLSREDWKLLERKELSKARYVVGGIVASYIGLGLGHTVQGRWLEKGWVFTLGESAGLAMTVVGLSQVLTAADCAPVEPGAPSRCPSHNRRLGGGLLVAGLVTYVGFRVWDAVDAWGTPHRQRQRARLLRRSLGLPPGARMTPYVVPTASATGELTRGAMAGLGLQF